MVHTSKWGWVVGLFMDLFESGFWVEFESNSGVGTMQVGEW